MVNTYQLVNPHIEGSFNKKIKAKNSLVAANILYKNLSEHFNNSVPRFYFSIQKGSSGEGKLYHFNVKEERVDDEVSFKISSEDNINDDKISSFKSNLDEFKEKFQAGGKKKKSRKSRKSYSKDDSDSDSDDIYARASSYVPTQPIYYWWYDPSLYKVNNLYVPTFYSYATPYVQFSISGIV